MANHYSDAARALDEMEALPADLQPLYQRLSDDGAAWQAASAAKIEALAQSLVANIGRMTANLSYGEREPEAIAASRQVEEVNQRRGANAAANWPGRTR